MRFRQLLPLIAALAAVLVVIINPALYRSHAQAPESACEGESAPLSLVWETEFSAESAIISPSDLVVDTWGNIYVSHNGFINNILKFDDEGSFVTGWGVRGSGEGQFSLSAGIAVDTDGNVYVADFNNIRVQKFDGDGNFLLAWATEPPAGPASLTVGADGVVYVDNFFAHSQLVQVFDPDGTLINHWGSAGTGEGELNSRPEDIFIDQDSNIYIADRLNHRVQKFDTEGNFLAVFGGEPSTEGSGSFFEPISAAVDAEGNLYVVDTYFVQKLDSEGNCLAQWAITEGGDLDRARGIIALNSAGDIYLFAHTTGVSASGSPITPLVVKRFEQP